MLRGEMRVGQHIVDMGDAVLCIEYYMACTVLRTYTKMDPWLPTSCLAVSRQPVPSWRRDVFQDDPVQIMAAGQSRPVPALSCLVPAFVWSVSRQ